MTKATPKKESKPNQPKFIIAISHLMTRFLIELEALSLYGETCLHSIISTLWNTYGINFNRVREPHNHKDGGETHFMGYTLLKRYRARAINQNEDHCFCGVSVERTGKIPEVFL